MSDWQELVIEGAEPACRAFVAGFAAGRRSAAQGVFGRDHGLAHESLAERLRDLFAGGSHHVVFAPQRLAEPLADALRKHGVDVGLRLAGRRVVVEMWFPFRVEVFSRPIGAAIRRQLFRELPVGVRIEDFNETEERDPSAHGTELYAPVHEYIYRASGRFVGLPPAILDVRRRACARDWVTVEGIHVRSRGR